MATNHSIAQKARRTFGYPHTILSALIWPIPLGELVYVFPLPDEKVLLVTDNSVHFLHLSSEDVLWSLFVAEAILTAALSPDQETLALALAQEVVLWDLDRAQVVQHLAVSLEWGDRLLYQPMGQLLAVAFFKGGVELWDTASGQLVRTLVNEKIRLLSSPKSLAFSPDGQTLALGYADGLEIWLWRVEDGSLLQVLEDHPWRHYLRGLAFSRDGRLLIGSHQSTDPEEEEMTIWELPEGRYTQGLPGLGWAPAVSPDGRMLATTSDDGTAMWDLAERKTLWLAGAPACDPLFFSPDGQWLVGSLSGGAIWWRAQSGQAAYQLFCAHPPRQVSAEFSRDGQVLATCQLQLGMQLWSAVTGHLLFHIPVASPQTPGCLAGMTGTHVMLWEDGSRPGYPPELILAQQTGDPQGFSLVRGQQIERAAYHEAGGRMAVAFRDEQTGARSLALWNQIPDQGEGRIHLRLPEQIQPFPEAAASGLQGRCGCLQFSPTGDLLVSGADDGSICLWHSRGGKASQMLRGHVQAVTCLAFDQEESRLFSGSDDGTVRVWDVVSGAMLRVLDGLSGRIVGVAVSVDGKQIAALDDAQQVRAWDIQQDIEDGNAGEGSRLVLQEHRAYTLQGKPFSPEEMQEGLHFWVLVPSGATYHLAQKQTWMLSIAFQEDGLLVVAGYCQGMVRTWRLLEIEGKR